MAYEKYTDEESRRIAGGKPILAGDLSQYTDDELRQMAGDGPPPISDVSSYSDKELMGMLAGDAPPVSDVSAYSDEELMRELAGDSPPPTREEWDNAIPVDDIVSQWESATPMPLSDTKPAEPPGLLSRTATNIGKAWTEATAPSAENPAAPKLFGVDPENALRVAGHLGVAAGDIMATGAKTAYKYGVDPQTQKSISDTTDYLASTDVGKAGIETFKGLKDAYGKLATEYPRVAQDVEAGLNALNLIPAAQLVRGAAPMVKPLGKEAVEGIGEVASDVISSKPVRWMTGRPDAEEAIKQVIQSNAETVSLRKKDWSKGSKALTAIDTTGVKSAEETIGKFNAKLPDLYKAVDDTLLKDPTVYSLDDLATVKKTTGGAEVSSNYVKTSINHLKELYTKTDDLVEAANMDELLARAEKTGLTKKGVNDIARKYNGEFGDKAFNAADVPLTSVNAETYRNVQQGLKEVSRRGLDDTAKEIDSTISAIYNTRRLMERNARATDVLKAKYEERGLGQRFGGHILTALDFTTMGIAKGVAMKVIPRGWGFKIRNAVDIDEMYSRNLKIINREIKRVEKLKPTGPTGPAEGPPPDMYPERPPS